MLFSTRSRLLFPVLLAFIGCRTSVPIPETPLALIPPGMKVERALSEGSVLSGPVTRTLAAPAPDAEEAPEESGTDQTLVYELTLIALEKPLAELDLDPSGLQALSSQASVVLDPELPRPLLAAAPGMMKGSALVKTSVTEALEQRLRAGEFGRFVVAARATGTLLPGEVARLAVTAIETPEENDNFLREWPLLGPVTKGLALAVDAHEADGPSQAAIEWRDIAKPATEGQREEAKLERPDRPGSALSLQREMLTLQPEDGPLRPDEGPLLLLIQSPFRQSLARSWIARFELSTKSSLTPTEREALNEESNREPTPQPASERRTPEELQAATLSRASVQLEFSDEPRAALSYLASGTGAVLAQDLSLALRDGDWEAFLETFRKERDFRLASIPEPTPEELGWVMESSSYRFLALMADEDSLGQAAEAVLLRHAGALGRFPGTIDELLSEYADLPSFRERVVFENRIFLEDSNPSDRVRAHDWLSVRELAVPGYDPLGTRTDRRAALEESERLREEQLKAIADGARELEEQL